MVGFRKGSLGSPFQTEYQGNRGMDVPDDRDAPDGPRIGPGTFAKKVTPEYSKNKASSKDD